MNKERYNQKIKTKVNFRFGMNNDGDHTIYLIVGAVVLVLILFATTLINFSFSSAYMCEYVNTEGHVASKNIWKRIKENLGTIILFVLLGIGIYIGYLIVSIFIAFIPLLGMLAQYGISFLLTAFFGLSFISIFSDNKGLSNALSEGWSFTFSSFGKVILYGFVIGILNMMIVIPMGIETVTFGFIYKNFLGSNAINAILFGGAFFIIAAILAMRLKVPKTEEV